MKKELTFKEIEFLRESNGIEGVYDANSLEHAIKAWKYLKTKKKLTPFVVKAVHKLLMKNQPIFEDEKGKYRKVGVTIAGRLGLEWSKIEEKMKTWCDNVALSQKHWQIHHIEYEKIHPFIDGNGRTGRMFMNWERLKEEKKILVIKAEDRQEYYKWFR